MISTEDLIDRLVREARPIRRLPGPLTRAGGWLAMAGVAIGGVIAVDGLCPNLYERLADPFYLTSFIAAGLTGALATAAAFMLSLPDRSRLWGILPIPALLVWLGAITLSCILYWTPTPPELLHPNNSLHCAGVFLTVSTLLTGLMFWMLRSGPLADGRGTSWLSGLAVTGLATVGLSLTRTFEESAMLLIWNLGASALTAPILALSWRWVIRCGSTSHSLASTMCPWVKNAR